MGGSTRLSGSADELLAILEDCLNNYKSDVHLFQSPLATWEVVRCRLPCGITSTPEQLAETVRAVLDDLIDALHAPESLDLNCSSVRRYIIADHLYRRGMKQTEICQSRLPLSKSQFYRERAETLTALAKCVEQWEQRAKESRKLKAIKTLAMLSPASDSRLIGAAPMVAQVTKALTAQDGPNVIMLIGLGGVGKTTLGQAAVEQVLHAGHFSALAWIACQPERFSGKCIQTTGVMDLTVDELFNCLLGQLRPSSVSGELLFDRMSTELAYGKVTFDEVLSFLGKELDGQDPNHLSLPDKQALIMDLLWATPTLIVVDGLEAAPDPQAIIENLRQIVSRTRTKVLITARMRQDDSAHVQYVTVTGLAAEDSASLLRKHASELGIRAVSEASTEDLKPLVEAGCGNPLILKWIVGQLASLPAAQALADLSQAANLSAELYNFVYRRAWECLSQPAQQLLVSIACSPGSRADWESLQRSSGLVPEVLNAVLKELVAACFIPVSETLDPAYQANALTRTFVLSACQGTTGVRKNGFRSLPRRLASPS